MSSEEKEDKKAYEEERHHGQLFMRKKREGEGKKGMKDKEGKEWNEEGET